MKKLSANSLLLALSPLLALVPAVAAADGPPVARAVAERRCTAWIRPTVPRC